MRNRQYRYPFDPPPLEMNLNKKKTIDARLAGASIVFDLIY